MKRSYVVLCVLFMYLPYVICTAYVGLTMRAVDSWVSIAANICSFVVVFLYACHLFASCFEDKVTLMFPTFLTVYMCNWVVTIDYANIWVRSAAFICFCILIANVILMSSKNTKNRELIYMDFLLYVVGICVLLNLVRFTRVQDMIAKSVAGHLTILGVGTAICCAVIMIGKSGLENVGKDTQKDTGEMLITSMTITQSVAMSAAVVLLFPILLSPKSDTYASLKEGDVNTLKARADAVQLVLDNGNANDLREIWLSNATDGVVTGLYATYCKPEVSELANILYSYEVSPELCEVFVRYCSDYVGLGNLSNTELGLFQDMLYRYMTYGSFGSDNVYLADRLKDTEDLRRTLYGMNLLYYSEVMHKEYQVNGLVSKDTLESILDITEGLGNNELACSMLNFAVYHSEEPMTGYRDRLLSVYGNFHRGAAQTDIGVVLSACGFYEDARSYLTDQFESNKSSTTALYCVYNEFMLGNTDKAQEYIDYVLKHDSENEWARFWNAKLSGENTRVDDLSGKFGYALGLENSIINTGVDQYRAGEYEKAVETFLTADDIPLVNEYLSLCYEKLGEKDLSAYYEYKYHMQFPYGSDLDKLGVGIRGMYGD